MQPQDFVPTNKEDWAKSDIYHNKFLIPEDPVLEFAVKTSRDNGLPDIAVSAAQGKFLNLVARSIRAKRILEVGTLGGYSTIWLTRALPADGKLVSLEIDQLRAKVAQDNLDHAGLMNKVEIKVGPAADTLKALDSSEPFDLVFIDADKPNNLTYFLEAKRLTRQGAVILVDNVVRWAKVALEPEDTNDRNVLGVRKLLNHLKDDKEVDGTTLGLVGDKGYDGILYAIKK
ncbi:O-methyltransferase family 3 protein [Fomitiporia mediterranea MF3/22]|uniref:O-methyltransferase family 3 protein n=1 Tax=Fomitiporia mediterranea (strain MF3/22) TaxID=694068 RepID=UPI0004408A42|nr:O-methyltransferase family 3 protein [Fomitiporia mediterranea MF3/22]EJD06021.1 O-methyltransferase family 3 protein [Fomitiporia mediterranea MF3/22]